ncbi:DNRLRE domain-containing protein [Fontivita pretiosa]|uniref:DNRLRE domain-containing protein n=1 Tax=Fontivita pretiosa TaxID=2989684 RepID=UPI003D166D84
MNPNAVGPFGGHSTPVLIARRRSDGCRARRRILRYATLIVAGLTPQASAETISLSPSKDNTLYQNITGATSNGAGPHFFVGRTNIAGIRRGVLAFDIASQLPPSSTVNAATLNLNLSRSAGATVQLSLRRALADWGEGTSSSGDPGGGGAPSTPGDATWIHRFYNTSFWSSAGGDFSPTPTATATISALGPYSISSAQLAADVQAWLDSPAGNFGWFVLGNEIAPGTALRFDTRENPDPLLRPSLTIDFSVNIPSSTWSAPGSGDWDSPGNWTSGVPDGAGSGAILGGAITGPATVTLNTARTLGVLTFDSPHGYTITGSGTLSINMFAIAGTIDVRSGSHTIGTALHLAGHTRLAVAPADSLLTIAGPISVGSATATISKSGAGAVQAPNVRAAGLSVSDGTLRIAASGSANDPAATSVVSTLSIGSAARLDLNNNALIVSSGSLTTITAQIKTGLENGGNFDWLGPGIGSTQANAQNTTAGSFLYGLGVVLNDLAQVGGSGPIYTDFAGVSGLVGTEVLVKFTYFGDADLSGSIDATDYSLIDNGYVNTLSGWINGDFDYSGVIDATDYALIDNAYVNQAGPLASAIIAEHVRVFSDRYLAALRAIRAGTIPEPAWLGLLVGAAWSLRRPVR